MYPGVPATRLIWEEKRLIKESFPELDLDQLLIVEDGRKPSSSIGVKSDIQNKTPAKRDDLPRPSETFFPPWPSDPLVGCGCFGSTQQSLPPFN
jgi:hypothetical protein